MEQAINRIEILTKELNSLLPMKQEDKERLEKKLRLEFNYNSNHIEGNTLTYGETELLLIFGKTTGNHELREYEEMKSHDAAYELVKEWASESDKILTEADIRNLNKIILVRPFWKEAITADGQPTRKLIKIGEYKEQPNSVRLSTGEIFHYASPADVPVLMHELIEWLRNEDEKKELHPAVLASLFHYRFVRIHPFDDGNGRLARLLMNYVLLKNNLPPVIIKSADKRNYLFALNQADAGDIKAFTEYIANQNIWSLELFIKAAKGEMLEEKDDFIKEIEIIKREVDVKGNIGKSPSLIYEIFKSFSEKIWKEIKETLTPFYKLFSENVENNKVNSMDKVYKTRSIFDLPWQTSMAPTPKTIFGFDVYDTNIKTIEWVQKFYGLKGADKNGNYDIKLELRFNENKYFVDVKIDYKTIFSATKNYDQLLLINELEEIKKNLSTYFLALIKDDTSL